MKKIFVFLLFIALQVGTWCHCSRPVSACSEQTQMSGAKMSCCSHQAPTSCCARELPPAQALAVSFQLNPEIAYSPLFVSQVLVVSSTPQYRVIPNESPPPKLYALTQSKAFRAPPL